MRSTQKGNLISADRGSKQVNRSHLPSCFLTQDLDIGSSRHSRNIVPPLAAHKPADVGLPFGNNLIQLSLAAHVAQLPHAAGILAQFDEVGGLEPACDGRDNRGEP